MALYGSWLAQLFVRIVRVYSVASEETIDL